MEKFKKVDDEKKDAKVVKNRDVKIKKVKEAVNIVDK